MDRIMIEQLHNSGKMPDRYYYQQVDFPLYVALQEQRSKIYTQATSREQEQAQEKEIYEMTQAVMKKALDDLFKTLK